MQYRLDVLRSYACGVVFILRDTRIDSVCRSERGTRHRTSWSAARFWARSARRFIPWDDDDIDSGCFDNLITNAS